MQDNLLRTARQLAALLEHDSCVVFDCRFDLKQPAQGRQSWLASHIPGAVYAHLDEDLAGPVTPGSGRHPLPTADDFADFLARSGWSPGRRVVAYDASGGAIAARLWWLMSYFGLNNCALLDGGISAWIAAQLPLEAGEPTTAPGQLAVLKPRPEMTLATDPLVQALAADAIVLLDARTSDRFAGRNETIDPVAGHVPGAVNRPFDSNLAEDRCFRPAAELEKSFRAMRPWKENSQVVHMCGSGVTACHNLFAMELAGLHGSRLYPGSWSEWIRDTARPVALDER